MSSSPHKIRPRRRGYPAALLAATCGLLMATTAADAQVRPSIIDRAKQDEARREALRNADRFGAIDGVVTDTLLQPLNAADVTVVGTTARVVTGANGRFRMLQVPPGQYLLVVRRIGYAPTSGIIEVPASDTLRLAYTLARSTMLLDTIRTFERRISTRMAEFEQRRAQGVGQFVTREEIERRGSLQVYDFLRNMRTIDVSRITDQMFGGMVALSRREAGSVLGEGAGACPMQVFLDGIILPRFFNLELLPPPKQIAGIEVYSGASSIPPQFGGPDRRCGVVAVWTRDGY